MNADDAAMLAVMVMCLIASYRMWKNHGTNRKYVIMVIVGLVMLFGGLPLRNMEAPLDTLAYIVGFVGWALVMIFLYKYYKAEKVSKKKGKK